MTSPRMTLSPTFTIVDRVRLQTQDLSSSIHPAVRRGGATEPA
jgi:hypothetical protein